MKVLITGAHGLLGRALLQADWGAGVERLACGRATDMVEDVRCHGVDLTNPDSVTDLWRQLRPDRVIHTAAVTNVDQCETEPELARRLNRDAVAHVVAASAAVGARLTHLSTDYVFDGANGPYGEADATNPLSQYGQMKLQSEAFVLDAGGLVVRTLWLYGHLRNVRPNLVTWPLTAMLRGDAMRIVSDQWGNPTYVHDLARALVALNLQEVSGLLHMGGTTFLTREELVRQVAAYFQLDAGPMQTITTADARQAAPRPLRSGLRTDAIEAVLGWTPSNLAEGLERMVATAVFREDFPTLTGIQTSTQTEGKR